MLSDDVKIVLNLAVGAFKGDREWLQEKGPGFLLRDELLDQVAAAVGPKVSDDIRANRAEAETYLAGLIGMM